MAAGDLDPTFGIGGKVLTPFPSASPSYAQALLIQPDGKIIAGGRAGDNSGIARYNANGSLDSGFGTGGLVVTVVGGAQAIFSRVQALVLQPDGKILAAGPVNTNAIGYGWFAARYKTDGSLDTSFGSGGVSILNLAALGPDSNNQDIPRSIILQSSGKIVFFGTAVWAGVRNWTAIRLAADGSLDTGFGTGGLTHFQFNNSGSDEDGFGMAVLPDDSLILTGTFFNDNEFQTNFGLAKLTASGGLDNSFGTGGLASYDLATNVGRYSEGRAVAYSGGFIYAAGDADGPANQLAVTIKTDSTGALVNTFGAGGVAYANPAPGRDAQWNALTLQPDGKVISTGWVIESQAPNPTVFVLTRLTVAGAPDPAFGSAGLVFTDISDSDDEINAVAVQPDTKIVVAGLSFDSNSAADIFALARYLGDLVPAGSGPLGSISITQHLMSVLAFQKAHRDQARARARRGAALMPDSILARLGRLAEAEAAHVASLGRRAADAVLASEL